MMMRKPSRVLLLRVPNKTTKSAKKKLVKRNTKEDKKLKAAKAASKKPKAKRKAAAATKSWAEKLDSDSDPNDDDYQDDSPIEGSKDKPLTIQDSSSVSDSSSVCTFESLDREVQ